MERLYTAIVTQRLDPESWDSIALYLLVQSLRARPPKLSLEEYREQCEAYEACRWWGKRLLLGERSKVRPKLQRLIWLATPAKKEVYCELLSVLEEGGWLG